MCDATTPRFVRWSLRLALITAIAVAAVSSRPAAAAPDPGAGGHHPARSTATVSTTITSASSGPATTDARLDPWRRAAPGPPARLDPWTGDAVVTFR